MKVRVDEDRDAGEARRVLMVSSAVEMELRVVVCSGVRDESDEGAEGAWPRAGSGVPARVR